MMDAVNVKPTLGTAVHAITGKRGWFVALDVQGWGMIMFGLALKARASRHSDQPATV